MPWDTGSVVFSVAKSIVTLAMMRSASKQHVFPENSDAARFEINTLVITNTGKIESMRGDSQLPYLLGNLSLMPFESLPADATKEWAEGNGLTIEDKARVAKSVEQYEEMAGNPFEVEGDDNGKGIRTWSDKSGRFKVEGEFQELLGGLVVLKGKDGKVVRIPKSRLSESDQKLIEKLSKI